MAKSCDLLIEDFLDYFEMILGNSHKTSKVYKNHLTLFFKYIMIRKKLVDKSTDLNDIDISELDSEILKEITEEDIYGYIAYCDKILNNSNNTKRKKVFSIKTFYKYLYKTKKVDEDIANTLEAPKETLSNPIYMTLDESQKLLNSIDGRFKERDYAIIVMFLNCGMRLFELTQINVDDIRGDMLTVMGKGSKERTIYLNDMCIDAIGDYFDVRPDSDDKALFLSNRKTRISNRMVQHMVNKYVVKAGLDKKYSVHKLRHTSATLLYKHGNVDIRTLQKILGHSNVATTQIYTHVDDEQLRDAVKKNPLLNN